MRKQILFLIVIIVFLAILFFASAQETWGLNKTVGWAWDLTNINWWIGVLLALLFFILVIILSYKFVLFLFKQLQDKKD